MFAASPPFSGEKGLTARAELRAKIIWVGRAEKGTEKTHEGGGIATEGGNQRRETQRPVAREERQKKNAEAPEPEAIENFSQKLLTGKSTVSQGKKKGNSHGDRFAPITSLPGRTSQISGMIEVTPAQAC